MCCCSVLDRALSGTVRFCRRGGIEFFRQQLCQPLELLRRFAERRAIVSVLGLGLRVSSEILFARSDLRVGHLLRGRRVEMKTAILLVRRELVTVRDLKQGPAVAPTATQPHRCEVFLQYS